MGLKMGENKKLYKVRNELLGTAETKSTDLDRVWSLKTNDAKSKVASEKIFDVNTQKAFKE